MSNKTYKKLSVVKLAANVAEATNIVESPLRAPADDEVLVKNIYAGVNAADVLVTSGQLYSSGKPPYTFGFEAIGVVKAVGKDVCNFKVNQNVISFAIENFQGYAEYQYVKFSELSLLPELNPDYIATTTGLTSCVGLDEGGRIKKGETVLITAAAGGIGHICVQWAKLKGCHVIGLTSSAEKAKLLRELGCDRIINYKTENLDQVLTKEYPSGVDVIWETIGGQVFKTLFNHLAIRGRLVLAGSISNYNSKGELTPDVNQLEQSMKLMSQSKSLIGFSLSSYTSLCAEYVKKIVDSLEKKQMKIALDFGESTGKKFKGLESVVRAIEYLQSGRNAGKVMIEIQDP